MRHFQLPVNTLLRFSFAAPRFPLLEAPAKIEVPH
jgi:hypothetical protein